MERLIDSSCTNSGRYGDLIDDRDRNGLSRIFVDDATFEIPGEVLDGLEAIREFMRGREAPPHPSDDERLRRRDG